MQAGEPEAVQGPLQVVQLGHGHRVALHEAVEAGAVDLVEVLLGEAVKGGAIDLVEVALVGAEGAAVEGVEALLGLAEGDAGQGVEAAALPAGRLLLLGEVLQLLQAPGVSEEVAAACNSTARRRTSRPPARARPGGGRVGAPRLCTEAPSPAPAPPLCNFVSMYVHLFLHDHLDTPFSTPFFFFTHPTDTASFVL